MPGQVEKVKPLLLALDASTTAVGWAVMAAQGDIVSFGVTRMGTFVPKGADWVERIDAIGIWLDALLREWEELVGTVAYEVATGDKRNMRTNRMLGAVEYETIVRARDWNMTLVPVTASQTKARVRQVTAGRLCQEAEERGLGGYTEHAVDAVAVGLVALQKLALR